MKLSNEAKSALGTIFLLIICFGVSYLIYTDKVKREKRREEMDRMITILERTDACVSGLNRSWNRNTKAAVVMAQIDECVGTTEWQKYMPRVVEKINTVFKK